MARSFCARVGVCFDIFITSFAYYAAVLTSFVAPTLRNFCSSKPRDFSISPITETERREFVVLSSRTPGEATKPRVGIHLRGGGSESNRGSEGVSGAARRRAATRLRS